MNVNNGRGLGRPQLQITELENDKTAERQAQEMVAKAEEDAAKAMQLERKSAADAAEEMKVELMLPSLRSKRSTRNLASGSLRYEAHGVEYRIIRVRVRGVFVNPRS